jgi:PAS domain S-box-containing protein
LAVSTDHLSGPVSQDVSASEQAVRDFCVLSPSAVLVLDSTQTIVQTNEIAAELFGATSPAALIGRDFSDFLSSLSRSELIRICSELTAGTSMTLTGRLSIEKFGGKALPVETSARRITWRDQPGTLCVVSDISELTNPQSSTIFVEDGAQQRLQEAIETMSEGFALFDSDRRLVLFNENYRSQIWPRLADFIKIGVTFEDVVRETLNRNVWEASGVDTETLLQQAIARHEDVPSLHEIQYPDGRCIQQSKRRTSDGGIVSVYSDITELKRREAEIFETQDRHRRLLETLPDGVVIHSGGKFAYLNPAAIQLLGGKTHTDLIGRNAEDFIPPEDQAHALSHLDRVLNDQATLPPEEQRRMRLDGRIINLEIRHTFIQWNAKPAVLTVLRDLTERKRAEHALQETERRYLTVAGNLPGAVYQRVMYPDGTIVYPYISRGVFETHGVDSEDVKQDGRLLTERVHPDDRDRFAKAIKESAEDNSSFDIEVRNIKPDGQMAWVRSLARSRKRDDGATVWDGIFVDITARKQAEERAAQAYRWLTEAIDSLSDGFALWDAEDRLVLWNDKFILGHPQRDLLLNAGLEFSELIKYTGDNMRARMSDEEVAGWIVERLQQHQEARGSYEIHTSTDRWLLVTERRTHEGYTVGIYTDITERKFADDELHASEERYRKLVQVSPDAIVVDCGGVIVFANDAAAKMFAVGHPDDLVGTDALDLVEDENRVAILSRRGKITESGSSSFEQYRYVRRDGAVRHCESAVSGISWEGESAFLIVIRDMEDRVQAERQQAIFGAVLDQAADSIEMSDEAFTMTYVNPAFEAMSGYASAEVVGRRPGDLFRPGEFDPNVYAEIEDTVRAGKAWSGLLRARRKDGTEYDQEAAISPVFNENGDIENYVAIKRDISQRVATQIALTESEEQYRKLMSSTPDGIYVHVDSKIVLVNDAAVEMFGAAGQAELIGKSVFDLMESDVEPVVEENQRRRFTGVEETLRMEQKRLRLDGEMFWASVSVTSMNWKGERGALVILRDISEQRRAQSELVRAMEAAEIANKSKSEFLANMSHELRTPLNAIIGFSEIMQNEMFGEIGNDHYTAYARDIHESGMHLLYVINDILDLSKIEAGKLSLSLSEVSLAEAIDASMRLMRQSANDANVTVEPKFGDDLPKIQVDLRMLKQMLMNLVSNAIKFTPSGGRIRVSVTRAGSEHIKIAVVDTGVGISPEDLPRVLEPFIQSQHPVSPRETGTGLGLPLTKSLAELHGGTFQLWSRVGFGTRAVLRLPIVAKEGVSVRQADNS